MSICWGQNFSDCQKNWWIYFWHIMYMCTLLKGNAHLFKHFSLWRGKSSIFLLWTLFEIGVKWIGRCRIISWRTKFQYVVIPFCPALWVSMDDRAEKLQKFIILNWQWTHPPSSTHCKHFICNITRSHKELTKSSTSEAHWSKHNTQIFINMVLWDLKLHSMR